MLGKQSNVIKMILSGKGKMQAHELQRKEEDKNRGVLFAVMMIGLGLALLFPWNAMLRTIGYLRIRLKGTRYEGNFANYMTTSFTLSNTLSMSVLVLGRADEFIMKSSATRIIFGLALNAIWLLVASLGPFTEVIGREIGGEGYFFVIMGTVLMMGASTALLQKGVYGYTAGLPVKYTPLMLLGQGGAGLVATLLSFGLSHPTPLIACFFFWSGIIIVLAALGLFLYLSNGSSNGRKKKPRIGFKQIKHGLNKISFYALGILIVMMVTLSLYPAVMSLVRPTSGDNSALSRVFLQLGYLTFDLGDLSGKFMPNLDFLAFGPDHLLTKLLPLLRFIFYPLFFACNLKSFSGSKSFIRLPDWAYFLVLFSFALTNGYSNALLLMNAPIVAARKETVLVSSEPTVTENEREDVTDSRGIAGTIMGLFINLGLASGSLLSFACRAYICKCNPFLQ